MLRKHAVKGSEQEVGNARCREGRMKRGGRRQESGPRFPRVPGEVGPSESRAGTCGRKAMQRGGRFYLTVTKVEKRCSSKRWVKSEVGEV